MTRVKQFFKSSQGRLVLFTLMMIIVISVCSFPLLAQAGATPAAPADALSTTGLATRVAAIMAAVYAVLQGLKQFFPSIGGIGAIIINVALSVLGFLVSVPADQLFTISTLLGLITAIAGSAGIHGTISSLSKKS